MDQDPLPIASVSRGQPYDFHDERFVTWWLNSLYLFPPDDQLAIAQLLRDAVHAPAAAREIEAFLTIRAQAPGVDDRHLEDPSLRRDSAGAGAATGILGAISNIWRTSPWTAGFGLCAVAFFLAKGVWFALGEILRMVF